MVTSPVTLSFTVTVMFALPLKSSVATSTFIPGFALLTVNAAFVVASV